MIKNSRQLKMVWGLRSNVIVGNGAKAEIITMVDEHGRTALASNVGFIISSAPGIEPESNMVAAMVVIDAISTAVGLQLTHFQAVS
ncbi:hypothetical protein PVK06_021951 [Gossypium arboreum]|uniref:Uncharacterized protein n=1 Tax=Gossypium arboreum TaxID=29729 RepID=A0ABR0PRE2_GOSAR|nr:hypothetical protein PVK06_021951 [Gossypium arboreum]